MAGFVGRVGDEQSGDVGDCAVIPGRGQTPHGRFLHRDGQQTGEDTFGGRTLLIQFRELGGGIGDLGAVRGGVPQQVVASLLRKEFGVVGWESKYFWRSD